MSNELQELTLTFSNGHKLTIPRLVRWLVSHDQSHEEINDIDSIVDDLANTNPSSFVVLEYFNKSMLLCRFTTRVGDVITTECVYGSDADYRRLCNDRMNEMMGRL